MAFELIAAVVFVVVLLAAVAALLQGRLGKVEPIFVINGFYMAMREKYTMADASIHYYAVEFDSSALKWKDFREKVLGGTDPTTAEKGSLRRDILENWRELGLESEPNVGDNGMHASASPFEAMAERLNWLGETVEKDPFARVLSQAGVAKKKVAEWTKDPQVDFEGGKTSLFDALEDMDSQECIKKALKIAGANGKVQPYLKNEAFVFIKPHAVTDKTKRAVEKCFEKHGITIIKEGKLDGTTIGEEQLIDKHYYAIANKASLSKPAELNVPAPKQEEFKKLFGLTWADALSQGKCYNAVDGCKRLGLSGAAMDAVWFKVKKAGKLVKFGGGFYCGLVEPPAADQ